MASKKLETLITLSPNTKNKWDVLYSNDGGKTTFENCVTSCGPCNSRKGHDHRIVPKNKPYKPSYYQLVDKRRKQHFDMHHPSWALYLGVE